MGRPVLKPEWQIRLPGLTVGRGSEAVLLGLGLNVLFGHLPWTVVKVAWRGRTFVARLRVRGPSRWRRLPKTSWAFDRC